jgi:hypothetical protein
LEDGVADEKDEPDDKVESSFFKASEILSLYGSEASDKNRKNNKFSNSSSSGQSNPPPSPNISDLTITTSVVQIYSENEVDDKILNMFVVEWDGFNFNPRSVIDKDRLSSNPRDTSVVSTSFTSPFSSFSSSFVNRSSPNVVSSTPSEIPSAPPTSPSGLGDSSPAPSPLVTTTTMSLPLSSVLSLNFKSGFSTSNYNIRNDVEIPSGKIQLDSILKLAKQSIRTGYVRNEKFGLAENVEGIIPTSSPLQSESSSSLSFPFAKHNEFSLVVYFQTSPLSLLYSLKKF